MGIAADARYRSIDLSFKNNDQDGSEFVQLLAKPSGGAWAAQRTFPVSAGVDQETTWDTALPLYAYDLALRYLQGSTAAVGYESSDPDAWTAPTAALSKGTVTTSCAPVTGLAGSAFVSSSTPITLTWSCAQQAVPFLVEKNAGAGWVTVVADLVATSYNYTIPGAELDTAVQFRVTPKRGSIAGTTSDTISVDMFITVGTPTWVSGSFNNALPLTVALSWTPGSNSTATQIERSSDGGGSYSVIATVSGSSYNDMIDSSLTNKTLKYRLTGKNGSVFGSVSTVQDVVTTIVVGSAVLLTAVQSGGPGSNVIAVTFTAATGPVTMQTIRDGNPADWPNPTTIYGSSNQAPGATSASFFYNAPGGGDPAGPKPFTTRVYIQTVYPGGYVFSNFIDVVMAA